MADELPPKDNVTPISHGAKKQRKPPKDPGETKVRLTKAELCHLVARAMLSGDARFGTPFPATFHVLEPNPGMHLILEQLEGGVVRVVPLASVAAVVTAWLARQGMPELLVTHRTAIEIAECWRDLAQPTDPARIAPILWLGEQGLTWHRLPWAREGGSELATWEGLLARMSNAAAFVDWVGSLFAAGSSLHQYVWMHGQGHDGKGAINRFFERVFGRSYRSKQPPRAGDKFWSFGLIGARLVVMPDCDNSGFVTSGLFKSLTGGDPIDVEAKGQMSGTVRLACKFLVLSNEKPSVSSSAADQRRVIYCGFDRPGDYDPGFEERLWEEGGAFLDACIASYESRYPAHGAIAADRREIEEIAAAGEDEFEVAFDSFLVPRGANFGGGPYQEHVLRAFTVRPADMQRHLKEQFSDRKTRREFVSWMGRKYLVRKAGLRVLSPAGDTSAVEYRYVGCVLKMAGHPFAGNNSDNAGICNEPI